MKTLLWCLPTIIGLCSTVARAGDFHDAAVNQCDQLEVSPVSLTEALLVSLEGANREKIKRVMRSNGEFTQHAECDVIHFLSLDHEFGGVLDVGFTGDFVSRLSGRLSSGQRFIWAPMAAGAGLSIYYFR